LKKLVGLALLVATGTAFAEVGAQYLVICPDSMYNSVQPLVQWKQAKGLKTKVAKLSETGSDTLSIRNYIRNAWANWPIRPEYILLVGDGSLLPARLYTWHGSVYCSSDNIYGDIVGDIEAEGVVGRLPAASIAQLNLMVAKTLRYEKNPDVTDSLWMRRMTTIVREDGDDDDTIYWGNIRNAATKAGAAGFVNCDSLSYQRGNSSTDVMASCNNGTGLVLYRGAASGSWYQPFDHVQPGAITATNQLCIVTSITCQTMALDPYSVMLGDSWMRAGTMSDLRGAVAFFGNTHPAARVAAERGAVARGFYNGLFDEGIWKLGRTALRAKHQLHEEFVDDTSDYRGFNLYGDPELGIWTATPRLLAVVHPGSIEPDSQGVTVTVHHDSAPVQNALVCASMDTSIQVTGYTDSTGQVVLAIVPEHEGILRLVVTGRNLYPYDTTIAVISTPVAEPAMATRSSRLGSRGTPTTFRGTTRITWNPARTDAAALTIFDATGRAAGEWTVAGTSRFEWSAGAAEAGIYIVVLRDRSGRVLDHLKLLKTE
jgi:hypothetical protein